MYFIYFNFIPMTNVVSSTPNQQNSKKFLNKLNKVGKYVNTQKAKIFPSADQSRAKRLLNDYYNVDSKTLDISDVKKINRSQRSYILNNIPSNTAKLVIGNIDFSSKE